MGPWIQIGFPRTLAGVEEISFNLGMRSARECMEWSYKDIRKKWTENDYPRMLKVRVSSVALICKASVVIWKIKVCMHHRGHM